MAVEPGHICSALTPCPAHRDIQMQRQRVGSQGGNTKCFYYLKQVKPHNTLFHRLVRPWVGVGEH